MLQFQKSETRVIILISAKNFNTNQSLCITIYKERNSGALFAVAFPAIAFIFHPRQGGFKDTGSIGAREEFILLFGYICLSRVDFRVKIKKYKQDEG